MATRSLPRRKAKPSPSDAAPLHSAAVLLGIIEASYENSEEADRVDALRGICDSVHRWVDMVEDQRDLNTRVYEALSVLGTLSLHAESCDWASVVGEYCDPVPHLIHIAKRLLEEAYEEPFVPTRLPNSAEEAA